jgi:4-oxalocrotonate tautomerase
MEAMPHLIVKLAAGRGDAVKQELADRLTTAVMDVLGLDADAVSVAMEEVPMKDWM